MTRYALDAQQQKDGRVYENQYHMLFTFRQGKIVEVKEYADTLLIAHMFG